MIHWKTRKMQPESMDTVMLLLITKPMLQLSFHDDYHPDNILYVNDVIVQFVVPMMIHPKTRKMQPETMDTVMLLLITRPMLKLGFHDDYHPDDILYIKDVV